MKKSTQLIAFLMVLLLLFSGCASSKSRAIRKAERQMERQEKNAAKQYDKAIKVLITGHTDNVGKPEKNLDLSKRRAENFKKILEGKGIDGNRVTAIGKGQTEPIATNKTKEGRAKNRRIEVSISSQDE